MTKKRKRNTYWRPFEVILAILAFIGLVSIALVSDRATGWGNKMIDDFLLKHQGDLIAWVFNNPFNFILAFSMLSLLILGIDAYFYYKGNGRNQTNHRFRSKKNKYKKVETFPKDKISNYKEINISYSPLPETLEEMRVSYQTGTSTDEKRLPYLLENIGDVTIVNCCIRMTQLKVIKNLSTNTGSLIERHENKFIKWQSYDKEKIDFYSRSKEHIILAKAINQGFAPLFHFVVHGAETITESTPRTFEGTWETVIQIEGVVEKDGMKERLNPIQYSITFEFWKGQLKPLVVRKL